MLEENQNRQWIGSIKLIETGWYSLYAICYSPDGLTIAMNTEEGNDKNQENS